jgi:hypothetical protein
MLRYRFVLQILGWILICLGITGFILLVLESFQHSGRINLAGELGFLKRSCYHFFNLGLISLGLSQFIRCMFGGKAGFLLRHGEKILYLYAVLAIWQLVADIWFAYTGKLGGDAAAKWNWFITVFPLNFVYQSTKALIFVGCGIFLKWLQGLTELGSKNA